MQVNLADLYGFNKSGASFAKAPNFQQRLVSCFLVCDLKSSSESTEPLYHESFRKAESILKNRLKSSGHAEDICSVMIFLKFPTEKMHLALCKFLILFLPNKTQPSAKTVTFPGGPCHRHKSRPLWCHGRSYWRKHLPRLTSNCHCGDYHGWVGGW